MLRSWWPRVGATSGILLVITFVVGDFLVVPPGSLPKTSATAHKIALFYLHHHKGLKMQVALTAGASLVLLALVVYLAHIVRQAEGYPGVFSRLTLLAGTAGASVNLVLAATQASLGQLAIHGPHTDGAFIALFDFQKMLLAMLTFPTTLLLGTIGVAALSTAMMPRWLAWSTFLLAILELVVGATRVLASHGFLSPDGAFGSIGFLLFLVWILITSVWLTTRVWNEPEAALQSSY